MPAKPFPTDVLDQAARVLDAWGKIDDQFFIGPLNAEALTKELEQARTIHMQLIGLANQLTELRNQRDAIHESIWDKLKRVRAGMKARFGDDSSQYEMVGGTRMSERKSPRRKTAVQE